MIENYKPLQMIVFVLLSCNNYGESIQKTRHVQNMKPVINCAGFIISTYFAIIGCSIGIVYCTTARVVEAPAVESRGMGPSIFLITSAFSDSFTILGLWGLGLAVSHINESNCKLMSPEHYF